MPESQKKNLKLSKSTVDKIPTAPKGKVVFYFDSDLKGFGLRVSGETKTFIAQARVNGNKVRCKLGRYGVVTPEQARKLAIKTLAELASGVNPNQEKKAQEAQEMTLREVFETYKESKLASGGLKPKTIQVYESALNRSFPDWLDKPIVNITREKVIDRYHQIATNEGPRSKQGGAKAQASQSMRTLRSIINFASIKFEDADGKPLFDENPVSKLSKLHKGWSRVKPRSDIIDPEDLEPWYRAVVKLSNDTSRDFLLFCLLTGLRRSAAAQLKWENIDFRKKTLTIPEEIDKTGREQRLPLSTWLISILHERSKLRLLDNPYIFPGGKTGTYLAEPKRAIAQVVKTSGVKFSTHTLRRTFATTAERLDISFYKVKHLMNHKLSDDVTATHYVQIDIDQLRDPMQLITDYFVSKTGAYLVSTKIDGSTSPEKYHRNLK